MNIDNFYKKNIIGQIFDILDNRIRRYDLHPRTTPILQQQITAFDLYTSGEEHFKLHKLNLNFLKNL